MLGSQVDREEPTKGLFGVVDLSGRVGKIASARLVEPIATRMFQLLGTSHSIRVSQPMSVRSVRTDRGRAGNSSCLRPARRLGHCAVRGVQQVRLHLR